MKFLYILVIMLSLPIFLQGQASMNTTCANFERICTDSVYGTNVVSNVSGIDAEFGPSYGCLASQENPLWYYMEVTTAGVVQFDLTQFTGPNLTGTPIDVDFIIWGPFPSNNVCNQLTTPMIADCSYSSSAMEEVNIASVNVGEWYIFMIANFSGTNGFINLIPTPSMTAEFACPLALCTANGPSIDTMACDAITLLGNTYTADAVVFDTLFRQGANGCDSVQPYNVTILNDCNATAAPNCRSIDVSIDSDDTARFRVKEFVTNYAASTPTNVLIRNGLGAIIYEGNNLRADDVIALFACPILGERLEVTVSNEFGTCWSYITLKHGNSKTLTNNLDTAVWCLDELITWDPNDVANINWYTLAYPFTLLPTADVPCAATRDIIWPRDTLYDYNFDGCINEYDARAYYASRFAECNYRATDWVMAYDCDEGDTSKIIIREWEAYDDKTNERSVTTDTIIVYKLPKLVAGNFYAPQKDTVHCFRASFRCDIEFDTTEYCWKQLVGLHSYDDADGDGVPDPVTYVYYPKAETDNSNTVILRRWIPSAGAHLSILAQSYNIGETRVPGISDYDTAVINGVTSYVVPIFPNDQLRSNNNTFVTATDDWFYEAGDHGFWIDLCLIVVGSASESTTIDAWQAWDCESGVRVLLPVDPVLRDQGDCTTLCLSEDVLNATKCFAVIHSEIKDLGGSCPRVVKKHFEIKQLCYSDQELPCDSAFERTRSFSSSTCYSLRESIVFSDTSGVLSVTEIGGSNTIEIEQWKMYVDTFAPLFTYDSDWCNAKPAYKEYVWSAGSHDCTADVRVPAISLTDNCSGVKYAKATIYPKDASTPGEVGYGWVNLTRGDDGLWSHIENRTFNLPCGYYNVYYEYADSCHNVESKSYFVINVVDNQPPNVITDDNLRLSLGGKDVWLDAEKFDGGTTDNCGIRMLLARRTDWKTACGVDLCSEAISGLSSEAELNNFIARYGITATLRDNDVEQYYADAYEWLRDDGEWCTVWEPTFSGSGKNRVNTGYREVAKHNYILEGWVNEIRECWAEECGPVDDHGNAIITVDNRNSLGGGWATKVPFCCEDACKEIVVELLAIDKECNYTKGWTVVEVEDKSPVNVACTFDPIEITCTSYSASYKDLIDAAIAAGNSADEGAVEAYAAVDEALGALMKGWRSDDNILVDREGNAMNKRFSYSTTTCVDSIVQIATVDTLHDGTVVNGWIYDTFVRIEEVEKEAQKGGVFVLCSANCIQDIWVELNDCGVGKVTRRWQVFSGCSEAHDPTPLIYEQVITVSAGCDLTKNMFVLEGEREVVCGALGYDDAGNVAADAGQLTYYLDDTDCRQLGISYKDHAFAVVGQEDVFKVHRTWKINDWCSGDELECFQKFVVQPCTGNAGVAQEGNVTGSIVTSYDQGKVQKVNVVGRIVGGDDEMSETDANGSFSFDVEEGASLEIVPSKDINLKNGVDIGDIIAIQSHILGNKAITNEYSLVAADVNKDEIINVKDILAIRQVTLERTTEFPNNESWRFFNELTKEETYTIENLEGSMEVNFVGVKVGDVDQQGGDPARSAGLVEFETVSQSLQAGEMTNIKLTSKEVLKGYQIALRYDPQMLDVVGVSAADLTDANWNRVADGLILVSYHGAEQSLNIEAVAKANVELSKALTIGNADELASVAVTSEAESKPVSIAFRDASRFELFQNSPNPMTVSTQVAFTLREASEATLTFFDLSGKVLKVIENKYRAGMNTVLVSAEELGATGVLYLQLSTETNSATKKFVVIK